MSLAKHYVRQVGDTVLAEIKIGHGCDTRTKVQEVTETDPKASLEQDGYTGIAGVRVQEGDIGDADPLVGGEIRVSRALPKPRKCGI